MSGDFLGIRETNLAMALANMQITVNNVRANLARVTDERDRLAAELDRVMPVYEAAREFHEYGAHPGYDEALYDALRIAGAIQ